jgi:Protein of unknown function (DUF2845)
MKRFPTHWQWASILLPLMFLLIWSGKALADRSFRCNGKIISVGSYKDQVLKICGEPDNVERWEVGPNSAIAEFYDYKEERYKLPKLVLGPLHMERWTYDLGSNQFIRYLLFRNGELINIETGEKGDG